MVLEHPFPQWLTITGVRWPLLTCRVPACMQYSHRETAIYVKYKKSSRGTSERIKRPRPPVRRHPGAVSEPRILGWAGEPAQAQQETPQAGPAGLGEQCLGRPAWRRARATGPVHLVLDLGGARHRPWARRCPARPLYGPGRAKATA